MMRQERAKQFMPFDAMKGLQEALRDREERHTRVERHDISDEALAENNALLLRLEKGDTVEIDCWHGFHDLTLRGRVTELSAAGKFLKLGETRVFFEDIYAIRLSGDEGKKKIL